MKRAAIAALLAAIGFTCGFLAHALLFNSVQVGAAQVLPVFSPDGSEPVLLEAIASAHASIDVMLYQFSYAPLQDALAGAAARGVTVRLLLDPKIDSNLYTAESLANRGVSVRWASRSYSSTHAKTMVVDGFRVFVGSTNWSRHAMKLNREAAVLIDNAEIASQFLKVFETDWQMGTEWKAAQ